jgi:NADPH:quinone reductase-like Zn-dependent oxidoreductase
MMKAVASNKKIKPDRLEYRDAPIPEPKADEVLIKLCATALNALDYRMIKMGILPKGKIPGADIAGIVEKTGSSVQRFKPGDEVIGDISGHGLGGLAEYATAPEKALTLKPARLGFEESAALPLAAVTALQALRDKGKIQKGKKVLIVGSSGGVGTFAVQLARYYGGTVTSVCSTGNVEQAISLGSDRVIDYKKEDFTKTNDSYDIILAVNGNYPLTAYKRLLRPGGIYVNAGGAMPQILKSIFFGKFMSFGSRKMLFLAAKTNSKDLEFIVSLAESGRIKPVIDEVYPFDKAIEAVSYMARGHARGKVVINIGCK